MLFNSVKLTTKINSLSHADQAQALLTPLTRKISALVSFDSVFIYLSFQISDTSVTYYLTCLNDGRSACSTFTHAMMEQQLLSSLKKTTHTFEKATRGDSLQNWKRNMRQEKTCNMVSLSTQRSEKRNSRIGVKKESQVITLRKQNENR